MKHVICILAFVAVVFASVKAQGYQNVPCGNCRGAGGWITAYGPVCCQVCRGYGVVSVPIQNSSTFRGNVANKGKTVSLFSYNNGRWTVVTQCAILYKSNDVWKVRMNNVDYVVKTGADFHGKTQYITIGMGYYFYL